MDFSFMKDWCITILTYLADGYTNKYLFTNKIEEVIKYCNLQDKKKMDLLYMETYSMAVAAQEPVKKALNENLKYKFDKTLENVLPLERVKRKLPEAKQKELRFMKDWCIVIYDYLNIHKSTNENFYQSFTAIIQKAFDQHDLRGMRMVFNDTNEMARGLPETQLLELNRILEAKFGRSLTDEEKEMKKQINKIVKRGKINNDDEFRLLEQSVSELSQEQSYSSEIETLNRLLAGYHQRSR